MWDYNSKVMDHFLNPRNVGEIPNADASAEIGNISCGDALKLFLKLGPDGRIAECKFQTYGCASAIASSSVLTEMVKGKTIEEARKITNSDIVRELGELPEAKIHCSVMGMEALQAAIQNLEGGKAGTEHQEEHEGTIVCHCFGVTDEKIRLICKANQVRKAEDVKNYIKAGGGCGCCLDDIQEILDQMWKDAEQQTALNGKNPPLSPVQKILKIQEVIEKEIKPALARDGGSIEFLNLVDNTVQVRLHGACATCPSSQLTLRHNVQAKLRLMIDPGLEVVEIRN